MNINQKTIDKLKSLSKPTAIAISGFGGSGKSTLANQLGEVFNAPIVCIDDFIDPHHIKNYSHWNLMNVERFKEDILIPFHEGKNPIIYRPTRWEEYVLPEKVLNHNNILIVEGVGIFQPMLMEYFSYSIWIDCPAEEAVRRGKNRDREMHRNPHDEEWDGPWKENDKQFYEKFQPSKLADQIIKNF